MSKEWLRHCEFMQMLTKRKYQLRNQRSYDEWVEEVREKIDAAIEASERTPSVDGETFVNSMLKRLR